MKALPLLLQSLQYLVALIEWKAVFGNGEHAGNVNLVTLVLNSCTQGTTPNLDFSNIHKVIDTVTSCNDHPRHPYACKFIFSALSGSHQDIIKKGFEAQAVIHVNVQSRLGGIVYLVNMQATFCKVVQQISDHKAHEVAVKDITTMFHETYHFGGLKYEGRLAVYSTRANLDSNTTTAHAYTKNTLPRLSKLP
ncbi:hypothetical protein BD769DRAFT_1394461 [Suillus cothurnatus]|nr:hypothetical protein BD769DRAFT_1394461 [Suillus cothurnatus]